MPIKKTLKNKRKFKILAATDIHGDVNLVNKLAEKAKKEKVDLVVLCGDLTWIDAEAPVLVGPFTKKGIEVLLIPGNHETPATANFLAKLYAPKVKNLHASYVIRYKRGTKKIGFFGCGSANLGLFQLNDQNIESILTVSYKEISSADLKIMVTHIPPFATKIDDLGFPTGSLGVRKAIEKLNPDFCLCGHIHETFGVKDKIGKTKVINVGRQGTILEI